MSKRFSRLFIAGTVSLIVMMGAVEWAASNSTRWESQRSNQIASVSPDTAGGKTYYTYYDALLPSPGHDTTGTAGDLFTATSADTLIFDVGSCDKISVFGRWDGDSVAYWIDKSYDRATWTAVVGSTFVNGTPSLTWTPLRTDYDEQVWRQMEQYPGSYGGTGVDTIFDGFMWRALRIRMLNMDADSFYVDGSPTSSYGDNAAADTVVNIEWTVACRD